MSFDQELSSMEEAKMAELLPLECVSIQLSFQNIVNQIISM